MIVKKPTLPQDFPTIVFFDSVVCIWILESEEAFSSKNVLAADGTTRIRQKSQAPLFIPLIIWSLELGFDTDSTMTLASETWAGRGRTLETLAPNPSAAFPLKRSYW